MDDEHVNMVNKDDGTDDQFLKDMKELGGYNL
jgi:hypothetical protein